MNDFEWAETQIDYTDVMEREIQGNLKYLDISLQRYIRSIEGATKRFKRLLNDEEREEIIKLYNKQMGTNDRYLTVLYGMLERERTLICLAC